MAPGGGALSRDKPPHQPLRSCVRKQTRYGPSKPTKRVSINPESPCFLVFNSIATPDLFFADPSTAPSLNSEDTDLMIHESVPPLCSLSLDSITGPAANRVKLPEGPTANTCEAADGPRQVRLLQEIENLSMGELKDKIREVWPRHPNRALRLTVIDPLRPTPPLTSSQVTMKRRQRQRRLRTAPVAPTHRTTSPEVASPASSPEVAFRPFPAGNGFSPF